MLSIDGFVLLILLTDVLMLSVDGFVLLILLTDRVDVLN